MENFFQYLENALPGKANDPVLYKFKKKTLDDMVSRANELTARGLKDDKVIDDLIISEYGDIIDEYKKYEQESKIKKRRKQFLFGNIIGSLIYIIALITVFLGVSFITQAWDQTWVIVVDGILLWTSYIMTIIASRILDMKRIFHFIARLILMGEAVVISVAVFIFLLGVAHITKAWVVIFAGILSMFLVDGIFAITTKQKLAIIAWLIYIPAMSAMLYIILGGLSIVAWSAGWVMIPLSLIIDLIIMLIAYKRNLGYKEEVVDEWQES